MKAIIIIWLPPLWTIVSLSCLITLIEMPFMQLINEDEARNKYCDKVLENQDIFCEQITSFYNSLNNDGIEPGYYSSNSVNTLPYALLLSETEQRSIFNIAKSISDIIEKALNYLISRPKLLNTYFGRYRDYFEYFNKKGKSWQAYARYDFIIDEQ